MSELARLTKLQRSSVHRATRALEETGIVEYVGLGPHSQIALRDKSPLAKPVRNLFRAEQRRYDDLIAAVKRAAQLLTPLPMAVWLEGPVAGTTDEFGDPLIVSVLNTSRSLEQTVESLGAKMPRIEQQFDVQIEVRSRTQADLETLSTAETEKLFDVLPLLGVPPAGMLSRYRDIWSARNIRDHSDHDSRALDFGRAIANAVTKNPSLISDARRYIDRRWKEASPGEKKELAEWKRILANASPSKLRKLLADPGERATRLRQTNPFVGLLPAERRR